MLIPIDDIIQNAIVEREQQIKTVKNSRNSIADIFINEIKEEIMDLKTIINNPTFTNIKRIVNDTQDNFIYNLAQDVLKRMKNMIN